MNMNIKRMFNLLPVFPFYDSITQKRWTYYIGMPIYATYAVNFQK
jgi:hypothetical protein